MGIVNSKLFSFSNSTPAIDMAEDIRNWLSMYNSSFISVETEGDDNEAYLTCTMNNLICFKIKFISPDAYFYFSHQYVVDDEPTWYDNRWHTGYICTIALSNSAFFLTFDNSTLNGNYRLSYVCEVINSDTYYGFDFNSNTNPKYLKNIYLAKYPESSVTYHHIPTLSYACNLGLIDYTPFSTVTDGIGTIADTNFIGCTNVTPFQVYTFNSNNYYAVDESTLFLFNNSLGS